MTRLSKSQFIRGLQCHKSLWLYKNRPELREEPEADQQAAMDIGQDVGRLARELFPDGEEIVFELDKIGDNIQRTKNLIQTGGQTIYEAAFVHDDILVFTDILHKGEEGWELYEVKASGSVKDVYLNDVALQVHVLTGGGITLAKACLVHINTGYVRLGEFDLHSFFVIADLTETVLEMQEVVQQEIVRMRQAVAGEMPAIDIGPHCSDPYECNFSAFCWQHVPEVSVFNLYFMPWTRRFELYNKGVLAFEDLPKDFYLSEIQKMQVETHLHGQEFINPAGIRDFLATVTEPTGFLDFETFMQAVPEFDNQRPYQQIPFQYSLHILSQGNLAQKEFLAAPQGDPREAFIRRLIADTQDCQVLVVYNQAFEKRILTELARDFPTWHEDIQSIKTRIIDLLVPFRQGNYYLKAMNGSFSIKSVLPALIPGMGYDHLAISNGGMAMEAFPMYRNAHDPAEQERIRQELLEYCRMDTLAMVRIIDMLNEKAV